MNRYNYKIKRNYEKPKRMKVLGIPYKNHYNLYDIKDNEKVYWTTRKVKKYFKDNNYKELLKEIEEYQKSRTNLYFNYINKY